MRWCHESIQQNVFNPPLSEATGPLAPLLRLADGQALGRGLFERFRLLSSEGCVQQKTMMDELARTENWEPSWWSSDWHPFAEDIAGGLLVLDAKTGEVIEFLHDDEARPLHGSSLEDWLTKFVARLESGELVYDEKIGVVEHDFRAKLAAYEEAKRVAQAPLEAKAARAKKAIVAYVAICIVLALICMAWSMTHG